jgi:purine-cytosine permease-like protein
VTNYSSEFVKVIKNWRWWVTLLPFLVYAIPMMTLVLIGEFLVTVGKKLLALDEKPAKWFCDMVDWVFEEEQSGGKR